MQKHPDSIFKGAIEWWQQFQEHFQEKPAFVQYAEEVLRSNPEYQRSQKLRAVRERMGID